MQKQIEIKNLSYGFENALVSNANATLCSSEIGVLIGENGVGKSTLLQCLLKQIPIKKGEITLMGKNLNQLSQKDLAKIISVVYSKSQYSENLSVFDVVALGKFHLYPYYFKLDKADILQVEHLINELHLEEYKNYPLSALSDGNLQKTFIARALAQDTPIIILDEPTTHLDEKNKAIIHDILQKMAMQHQKSILFSSHDWRSSHAISHWVWQIENGNLHSHLFEDFLQNQLHSAHHPPLSSEKLPKIIANENDTHALIDFIVKNQFKNLSPLCISKFDDHFEIKSPQNTIQLYNWMELKQFLSNI